MKTSEFFLTRILIFKILRLTLSVFSLFFALTYISCSSDDDPEEAVRYKLIVNNTTSENVDLYLNSDLSTAGFVSEGTVVAGQQRIINNLIVGGNYTLRASLQGNSSDNFFDEQTFTNDSDADISIDITD